VVNSGYIWGTMIFTGQYRYGIDDKNRLFIPAKLRKGINNFFITIGLDDCLYVYPEESWKKLIEKFDELSLKNKAEERAFKRAFLSMAAEIIVDGMGRILVPQDLKQQVGISKKIVIVGVWDRLEIWPEEKWNTYYTKAKTVFKKLTPELEF